MLAYCDCIAMDLDPGPSTLHFLWRNSSVAYCPPSVMVTDARFTGQALSNITDRVVDSASHNTRADFFHWVSEVGLGTVSLIRCSNKAHM